MNIIIQNMMLFQVLKKLLKMKQKNRLEYLFEDTSTGHQGKKKVK